MRQGATIMARLNGRLVYRRVLQGYLGAPGLELAIQNAVRHDFRAFECDVIRWTSRAPEPVAGGSPGGAA